MSKLSSTAKVDRDFVLKRIEPHISLAKYSTENRYGKDYRVIHNNHVLEGEHVEIFIENDLIEVYNIEIIKKGISFSKSSLDIKIGHCDDLVENERIYFKIDLGIKIKILISPEQHYKIYNKHLSKFYELPETQSPQFLNIIYPFSANNMQRDIFLFINSKPKLIEGSLFYELSFDTMEKEGVNDLEYFYKKTLDKHLFIPREVVLEHYEYRE